MFPPAASSAAHVKSQTPCSFKRLQSAKHRPQPHLASHAPGLLASDSKLHCRLLLDTLAAVDLPSGRISPRTRTWKIDL